MGGLLTAMKLEFARLRRVADMPAAAAARVSAIETLLNGGIALKRRIVEHLRPSSLDQLGLVSALEMLCNSMASAMGRPVLTDLTAVHASKEEELTIFRLVQESLSNCANYAEAKTIRVSLGESEGEIRVVIADDGRGFDPLQVAAGRHGLKGMRFRIESHGGHFEVHSQPGHGTRIRGVLPSRQHRPNSSTMADQAADAQS
jgi:signal transduction histidine kinase